jgi:hypothetical protein
MEMQEKPDIFIRGNYQPLPDKSGRRAVCRWLFLAWLSQTFEYAKEQSGVLGEETGWK